MAVGKREQERKTMDKTTLCYCTPNLHKLVHQAPLCGGILASNNNNTDNDDDNNKHQQSTKDKT